MQIQALSRGYVVKVARMLECHYYLNKDNSSPRKVIKFGAIPQVGGASGLFHLHCMIQLWTYEILAAMMY